MERALLILCALLLNAALAGPRRWYALLGLPRLYVRSIAAVRDIERRLDREHRSVRERELRGMLLVTVAIVVALLLGWLGDGLLQHNLRLAELLLLTLSLPVRPTWDSASAIRKALAAGDAAAARQVLDGTIWRHYAALDEYGVARAGVETLAVHFSEKIVAPALLYLALGLPGLFISKAVYLLEETLSRPGGGAGFASATRAVHYLLHYVPSRLAALLWLAATLFLPSAKIEAAAKPVAAGFGKASPHVLSLLAAASVLHLSLGGPTSVYVSDAWIGAGTARPGPAELKRALYLFALLNLLFFIFLGFFL